MMAEKKKEIREYDVLLGGTWTNLARLMVLEYHTRVLLHTLIRTDSRFLSLIRHPLYCTGTADSQLRIHMVRIGKDHTKNTKHTAQLRAHP